MDPLSKDEGFAATVHDPVWFLCRQWQFGEHQGENASSPVLLQYKLESSEIKTADGIDDLTRIPAEAIVESEPDDWWTMGRRIRIGRIVNSKLKNQLDTNSDDYRKLLFSNPPPPYEQALGQLDGLLAWKMRYELSLADEAFGEQRPPGHDTLPAWDSSELIYRTNNENSFRTDRDLLIIDRHLGGRLDWYTFRAEPHPEGHANGNSNSAVEQFAVAIPTALEYPGSPNGRWWQFENAELDISTYVPDDAHTPTAFLTDLVFSHGDDWFLFPVQAKVGNVVSVKHLWVIDSFGRSYKSDDKSTASADLASTLKWPGLAFPDDWTIYQIDGLKNQGLVLLNFSDLPLQSLPIEKVLFGVDEQSNLVWAVERNIDHRDVDCPIQPAETPKPTNDPLTTLDGTKSREYLYIPAKGITPYWHPYVMLESNGAGRKFEQQLFADFSKTPLETMPRPKAEVLASPNKPHRISAAAIPSSGLEIERRWQLSRDQKGAPVLWIQKQRKALRSPPARTVMFDLMEAVSEDSSNH